MPLQSPIYSFVQHRGALRHGSQNRQTLSLSVSRVRL